MTDKRDKAIEDFIRQSKVSFAMQKLNQNPSDYALPRGLLLQRIKYYAGMQDLSDEYVSNAAEIWFSTGYAVESSQLEDNVFRH